MGRAPILIGALSMSRAKKKLQTTTTRNCGPLGDKSICLNNIADADLHTRSFSSEYTVKAVSMRMLVSCLPLIVAQQSRVAKESLTAKALDTLYDEWSRLDVAVYMAAGYVLLHMAFVCSMTDACAQVRNPSVDTAHQQIDPIQVNKFPGYQGFTPRSSLCCTHGIPHQHVHARLS